MRVLPRRRLAHDDDGFSLVETVIALTIAAFAFGTLSLALIGGVHASVLSQQNQQAGDMLSQSVEKARALGYDRLAMQATDLDTGEATRAPTLSSSLKYSPTTDLTYGGGVEWLAPTDPAGGVSPHVTLVSQNGLTYSVRRYVTAPVDAFGATYKRLTVVVSWTSLGKSHKRSYSTIVTATKRGLPLPDYKFTATGGGLSQCRNPASQAVYSFTVKNNGARDSWNLAATGGGSWDFYEDTNANNVYDLGDSSLGSAGSVSTGLLEPTTQKNFFAVASVPSAGAAPPPYTWSTTFRATSAAQPGYFNDLTATTVVQSTVCGGVVTPTPTATATASPTASPTPVPAPTQPAPSCPSLTGNVGTSSPSGTMVRYYFANPAQPGNTDASLDMPTTRDGGTPPASGPLYAYSQDLVSSAGRYVETGVASTGRQLASWLYQMPATSSLKGSGSLTFWASTASGDTTQAPAFSATLDLLNSNGTVKTGSFASGTYTTPASGWGCAGLRPFTISFGDWNGNGDPVAGNEKLRLSVRVTNNVPVLLAYGTSAYPSEMQLPYASGQG